MTPLKSVPRPADTKNVSASTLPREVTVGSQVYGRAEHSAERPTLAVGKAFVIGTLTGFPLKACSRCGGCGRYSYCPMYQDRCFGCGGQGVHGYNKATAAEMNEWNAVVRRAKKPVWRDVKVGDKVTSDFDYRKTRDNTWATVVSIEPTDEVCGSSRVGNADPVYSYRVIVTLDNGLTGKLSGNQIVRRAASGLDATPYIDRAWASLPKYVQAARADLLAAERSAA